MKLVRFMKMWMGIQCPWWYSVLNLVQNSDHTCGRSGLSPLIHCSILYHSGCLQTGFFSHSRRGGYTKDSSNVTIWLIESRRIGESSLAVSSTSASGMAIESDDTSEVERMKFAHDDAEVWDRAEEMYPRSRWRALPSSANNMGCSIHSIV